MHFRQVFNNGTIPPVLKMITVVIIIVVGAMCVFCGIHVCIHIHMNVFTSLCGGQRTSHVFLDCPPLY